MTQKELNAVTAKTVAASPFWNGKIFTRYFSPDFTMDVPTAPPGMPNHYSTWEAERCFEWLNRSVRSWDCEIKEFYSTPTDANLFWAVCYGEGDVFWNEYDGHWSTEYYLKIEFDQGRISHMVWRFDAFTMLQAAGKKVNHNYLLIPETEPYLTGDEDPAWAMELDLPEIDEYIATHHFGYQNEMEANTPDLDMSPEAVRKRKETNLQQYVCGVEREKYRSLEVCSKDYENGAVFSHNPTLPPMSPERTEEVAKLSWAWGKVCSPWMYRDPRGKIYETDDPNVYFIEMNCHGPGAWRANGVKIGHYRQDYLVYVRFDDAGRVVIYNEILNPVNGWNSVAADVPNFPYYH